MKLEAVSVEERKGLRCKRKRVMDLVEEFWKSDMEVARVEIGKNEYSSISSAQTSFNRAIKRLNVGVYAVSKNKNIYLVKENLK